MLHFDDLQLIATVLAHRTPRRAAAAQKVHVATIYRRLRDLEQRVGHALFETGGGGYSPTPLALELAEAAERISSVLDETNRRATGHDNALSGTLRLTTTDTLAPLVLQALLPFNEAHPAMLVDIAFSNGMADMIRHEADVAIRPTRSPPETLVGRRLATFDFAVYAAEHAQPGWIGLDDTLSGVPAAAWAEEAMPDPPRLRVNSFWAACEAAIAGHGKAVLPGYLARGRRLERIGEPISALRSEVWILFHPDLRRTPRIRRFTAIVGPALSKLLERP